MNIGQRGYIAKGKFLVNLACKIIWTSFFYQFVYIYYILGEGVGVKGDGCGGSCEDHFIRVHKNLVQHPNNNKNDLHNHSFQIYLILSLLICCKWRKLLPRGRANSFSNRGLSLGSPNCFWNKKSKLNRVLYLYFKLKRKLPRRVRKLSPLG